MSPLLIVIVATTPSTPTTAPDEGGAGGHPAAPRARSKAIVVPSPTVTGAVRRTQVNGPGRIEGTCRAALRQLIHATSAVAPNAKAARKSSAGPEHEPVGMQAAQSDRPVRPTPVGTMRDARNAHHERNGHPDARHHQMGAHGGPDELCPRHADRTQRGASSLITAADRPSAWPTRTSPAIATTDAEQQQGGALHVERGGHPPGHRVLVEHGRAGRHVACSRGAGAAPRRQPLFAAGRRRSRERPPLGRRSASTKPGDRIRLAVGDEHELAEVAHDSDDASAHLRPVRRAAVLVLVACCRRRRGTARRRRGGRTPARTRFSSMTSSSLAFGSNMRPSTTSGRSTSPVQVLPTDARSTPPGSPSISPNTRAQRARVATSGRAARRAQSGWKTPT